jgi:hypothetical protein
LLKILIVIPVPPNARNVPTSLLAVTVRILSFSTIVVALNPAEKVTLISMENASHVPILNV